MFEAAIMPAVVSHGDALRPLDWSELVARLSAARDLRSLVARSAGHPGSFAAAAGTLRAAAGQRPVNHDALGRGKAPAAISVAAAEEADVGDQGTR